MEVSCYLYVNEHLGNPVLLFERKAFSEDNKDILNNVNFALKVS